MEIRTATLFDKTELLSMFEQGEAEHADAPASFRASNFADLLNHVADGRVLVAIDGDKQIAGMVSALGDGPLQSISHIFVKTAYRGMGLGVRLLDAGQALARSNGARTVVLVARNDVSPTLYERAGYKPIGVLMEIEC